MPACTKPSLWPDLTPGGSETETLLTDMLHRSAAAVTKYSSNLHRYRYFPSGFSAGGGV